MEIKRIAAIAGVMALLMFGAFAAGGMNRSVSSAQSATGTAKVAQQADKSDNEANDSQNSQKLASQAKISEQQAKDAALAANPGATVVQSELEDENGVIVYSIDLNNNREVKVDAKTGSVGSVHDSETDDGGADSETNDD